MDHISDWQAHVHLYEHDAATQARVVLYTGANTLIGEGLARRNPADQEVREIGDELAVGRAFIELGERLVRAAAEDVAALTRPI
jgi:Domain of unknown function (DUF1876)